jgi:hypothetical protein
MLFVLCFKITLVLVLERKNHVVKVKVSIWTLPLLSSNIYLKLFPLLNLQNITKVHEENNGVNSLHSEEFKSRDQ